MRVIACSMLGALLFCGSAIEAATFSASFTSPSSANHSLTLRKSDLGVGGARVESMNIHFQIEVIDVEPYMTSVDFRAGGFSETREVSCGLGCTVLDEYLVERYYDMQRYSQYSVLLEVFADIENGYNSFGPFANECISFGHETSERTLFQEFASDGDLLREVREFEIREISVFQRNWNFSIEFDNSNLAVLNGSGEIGIFLVDFNYPVSAPYKVSALATGTTEIVPVPLPPAGFLYFVSSAILLLLRARRRQGFARTCLPAEQYA